MQDAKMGATNQLESQKNRVIVHAVSMAFGTMSSRVLGLVREMLFSAFFNRTITDAWSAAFKLPNLFRRLLGEGSLSVSFIPVFVDAKIQDPGVSGVSPRAKNLVNSFYTLLLIIVSVLTILGIVYVDAILNLLLHPEFRKVPGKFELTVRFARIMFGFIFLMSTYAYFMGILNALGKFALAATAPTLFNISMIISTLLPVEWFPVEGDGLAWGVIVGGVLQTGILIPALVVRGYFPKIGRGIWTSDVKRVLQSMTGGLVGLGLMQITTIVNMRFSSELGEGAISYIYWADRLLELPLSLVSVSLGTALLPTLASMWSHNERAKMSETANFYLRLNLFVGIPCAIGLYMLAHPIIELIFQRGLFTSEDSVATAKVLEIYALILVPVSSVRVLAPVYYAVKNTWYPALVSGFALMVHVVLAPWLMKFYGLQGLIFSTLISGSINFLMLLGSLSSMVTFFNWKLFGWQVLKFLIPGAAMAVSLTLYPIWRQMLGDELFGKVASLGLSIFLAGVVYFFISMILRLEESKATTSRFIEKIRKKFT